MTQDHFEPCDVCYGTPGRYPIIDRFGSHLYEIVCPHCLGMRLDPIIRIASDLAPDLERLLHDWLSSDMIPGSPEHRALERFLWDNKVGMLRVLESSAVGQTIVEEK